MTDRISARDDNGRLCYFLVCFKSVEYVAYLLSTIYDNGDLFLIHCDKKAPHELCNFLKLVSKDFVNVILLESQDYSWAGYSHVEVSLRAMDKALDLSTQWSHLIFLSEQHLPLKSPDGIAEFLRTRRSVVALRQASLMSGQEEVDLKNRSSACYKELPGVGSFATGLAERKADFFENVYHGSNWMILHRDHCVFIVNAERQGRLDEFRTVVHAEENAIQSIIAPLIDGVDNFDATLVAHPHMTDNNDLIMSDDLFLESLRKDLLFIRKRQATLSPAVDSLIKKNHFESTLYDLLAKIPRANTQLKIHSEPYLISAQNFFAENWPGTVQVHAFDPLIYEPSPKIHFSISTPALRRGLTVRVLSENLRDFKISIVQQINFAGNFQIPFVEDGILYANIRAKVFDLFGQLEILPMKLANGGFLSIENNDEFHHVNVLTSEFLVAAVEISKRPDIWNAQITS